MVRDELFSLQAETISRIQSGERQLIPELWTQLRPLTVAIVRGIVRRSMTGGALFDEDDLMQEAWLALPEALQRYDPERGSFARMYGWCIMRATRKARGTVAADPLFTAVSLNVPLSDDESGGELGDVLPDTDAEGAFDTAEDSITRQDLRAALAFVDRQLTEQQRAAVRLRFCDDLTAAQTSERLGITPQAAQALVASALRVYRRPMNAAQLRRFIDG